MTKKKPTRKKTHRKNKGLIVPGLRGGGGVENTGPKKKTKRKGY